MFLRSRRPKQRLQQQFAGLPAGQKAVQSGVKLLDIGCQLYCGLANNTAFKLVSMFLEPFGNVEKLTR
jgi:hypothetical protein